MLSEVVNRVNAVTFFFVPVVLAVPRLESCSDPCSKYGCGRVQLERRRRVGRAGSRVILAQVYKCKDLSFVLLVSQETVVRSNPLLLIRESRKVTTIIGEVFE